MKDDKMTTYEMLIRIGDGDKNSFNIFFRRYYEKLIKIALLYVRGYSNAEDVVSDVFVKILKRKHQLHKIERFDGYLFLMVKNQCLDFLKKNVNQSHFQQLDENEDHYFYGDADLRNEVEGKELKDIINQCVEKFPPRRKMVYKLIKEDGLKYKEVAEILSISPKTVENHLDFALKTLRAIIGHYLSDDACDTPIRSISK